MGKSTAGAERGSERSECRTMIAVLQRVSCASVEVERETHASITRGLLVYLGVAAGDEEHDAQKLAEKVMSLRIFPDEAVLMNRSLRDGGGEVLVVSQFTLLADTAKGRRPNFLRAAAPDTAQKLYERFCIALQEEGIAVQRGVFGARMQVHSVNDGPVTIILDTKESRKELTFLRKG